MQSNMDLVRIVKISSRSSAVVEAVVGEVEVVHCFHHSDAHYPRVSGAWGADQSIAGGGGKGGGRR